MSKHEDNEDNGVDYKKQNTQIKQDISRQIEKVTAPDGGWGWMVILGSFLVHFLLGGLNRSWGVFYIQLRDRYHSSAAITNWIGGAAIATRTLAGNDLNVVAGEHDAQNQCRPNGQ